MPSPDWKEVTVSRWIKGDGGVYKVMQKEIVTTQIIQATFHNREDAEKLLAEPTEIALRVRSFDELA